MRLVGKCINIFLAVLPAAIPFCASIATAADRIFSKQEAEKVAATLVPALPEAPRGWKIK